MTRIPQDFRSRIYRESLHLWCWYWRVQSNGEEANMTTEQKRTPGPWTHSGSMNGRGVVIHAAGKELTAMNGGDGAVACIELPHIGMVEADSPSEAGANAAFIVCACNAHDDLVAALDRGVTVVETYADAPDFKVRM